MTNRELVSQPVDAQRQPAHRTRDGAELAAIARELRKQVIRLVAPTGQGYVQQGLGAADLFATLFFSELRLDPADPDWVDRDRFLLSTAHNTAIFYAALAERGCLSKDALASYCKDGSALEINASERVGSIVEATCGSLGQGLSVAVGMAASLRRNGRDSRVYVVLGDGEMQEGQVWEAALLAASQRLDNLCLILDLNFMQVGGHIDNVVDMNPIAAKWQSFGFHTIEIDGNDIGAILGALDQSRRQQHRPTCIVARTLVGKGAPSLEGILGHNMKLPDALARQALAELDGAAA
jgi:transketolase